MKSMNSYFLILIVSSLSLFGCARSSPMLPVHDEVLAYPLPMDLTFLRTLEAVEAHPDWKLDRTEKEKGLVYLRNLRYSSFADADRRTAVLVLKRVGPHETSVELSPESQAVVGGDELLSLIKQHLSREADRK